MVLTVYKQDASPPSRSMMMVIEAIGISDVEYVECIDVNLLEGAHLKAEYTKMNPLHIRVPKADTIYIKDGNAIVVYLATKYGSNGSLYPADPKTRAVIHQRLHFDSGILLPALRGTVDPVFFFGESTLRPENLAKIQKAYDFSEKFLTKTWMAGDELTIADIVCFGSLSSMNAITPIDAALYPKLAAWLDKCSQEEFAKKANEAGLAQFRGLLKLKLG